MFKWLAIILLAAGAGYYTIVNFSDFGIGRRTAIIDGNEFSVQIADSEVERNKGLSGKGSMSHKDGLLFIFDKTGDYGFWMKDMNFPIDIIWIKDDKVVYVLPDVKQDSYPNVFYSSEPANEVLEINAGLSEKLGINAGDSFLLK